MNPSRAEMERALKAVVIPKLRDLGFKGSMPHFRRVLGEKADLLTFQFNLSGGSFVAEMSVCSQADIATHWRAGLSLKTVTVHDMSRRHRLGSEREGSDHWFVYGKKNYEPGHEQIGPQMHYERIAIRVAELLDSQAEQWWSSLSSKVE